MTFAKLLVSVVAEVLFSSRIESPEVESLAVESLAVESLAVELLAVESLAVELLGMELLGVELLGVELLAVESLGVELLGGNEAAQQHLWASKTAKRTNIGMKLVIMFNLLLLADALARYLVVVLLL